MLDLIHSQFHQSLFPPITVGFLWQKICILALPLASIMTRNPSVGLCRIPFLETGHRKLSKVDKLGIWQIETNTWQTVFDRSYNIHFLTYLLNIFQQSFGRNIWLYQGQCQRQMIILVLRLSVIPVSVNYRCDLLMTRFIQNRPKNMERP